MAIAKTSDGVPRFDGSPELLASYREEAVQYLMTFEYKKRYIAGPRLLRELEGTAKLVIRSETLRNPQWVSHPRGVYTLLDYLESAIARPSLPEASRFVTKFFYGTYRKKNESMTSWVTRHAEALWEASQALRKVQKEYGPGIRKGWSSQSASSEADQQSQHGRNEGPFRDDGRLDENEEEEMGWWQDRQWRAWSEWSSGSWKTKEYEPPESWDTSSEIFIPEFLAGFLLLNRSGLDANERGNILAAIRGEFSTEGVGKALREQWTDEDLLKRDRLKMGSALYAEEEEDNELSALLAEEDAQDLESLGPQEQEAFLAEQSRVEAAMEAVHAAKATLREARWKQKQIKLGRGYYPPKPFQKGSGKGNKGSGSNQQGPCFKCGGPHKVADCPQRQQQHAKVADEESSILKELPHLPPEVWRSTRLCWWASA